MDNNVAIGQAIANMDGDKAIKDALRKLFGYELSEQGKVPKATYLKVISDGSAEWSENPDGGAL